MIKRLDIDGVHMELGKDLKMYVQRKIGGLDRYVSPHTRESLHAEVKLKEGKAKDKNRHTCEVILHLPQDTFTVKESAGTIFSAIDIVEEKLKIHLKKYKDLHTNPRLHQRIIARLKRSPNLDV
jgi:ribosomal subunit interface protein